MKQTRAVALCGVLAALAVTVMLVGGMFPLATYCAPVIACLLLTPVRASCGTRLAWAWYVAVAVLACLLGPDKEAAALFVFLGYYPILKPRLDRIRPSLLRRGVKLLFFAVMTTAMYALLILVMGMAELWEEFRGMGLALCAVTAVLGAVTFGVTDLLISRVSRMWSARAKRKFK